LIRKATRHDIPRITEIRAGVRENKLRDPSRVTIEDVCWFIDNPGIFVCESGGKIVGFSAADPRNGNISALFVEEDYEGRGIGQALFERACGVLVEARSPRMWLTTWPGTRAEQFYRRAGWRVVGTVDGNLVFERESETAIGAGTKRTVLRPARPEDFDYCSRLYFEGMENVIKELKLDMTAQIAGLRQRWDVTQVRIVTLDGTDIGWLQSFVKDEALFLGQLFVDKSLRGQGIGTKVVKGLIEEAASAGRAVTLGVVKTNPALRLYERLGFRRTHADERKFYLRRD
jgi:GNAT superfamily N-acetyltransferase